ncbi:glycosyltransferase family 4 protein [Sphingomonas sp.]|uniref:glycosyltransferase family 4 protein n=1 Tax=Sphingomonas sp. TaxID=28214 RepID=UPI0025CF92B4|nr:glycosyltransferase family 4 protein [Sphingomonas sp.]MBV9528567.1 glycosyltransferase family 4 protein [Sphingomonas sp.]
MPQDDKAASTRPILYISYDGLTDPLGRSQILPYLVGCARRGYRIHILSCEKPGRFERDRARVRAICDAAGIGWHPLPYHKAPPVVSTMVDLAILRREATRLHRTHRFGLVHCRSYIAAAAGLDLKRRFRVPLLFDMRGFWPEEKTEGGSWNLANPFFRLVYRYFKRLESVLLRTSDAVVILSRAGKAQLLRRPELAGRSNAISVIPCCVDFDHFPLADAARRAEARTQLRIPDDAAVLVYLGSLGTWYMLPDMLDCFSVYRERHPGARFLFITLDDPSFIRIEAAQRGIANDEIVVSPASREDVPLFLTAADLGISFIRPVFSKIASSPTKMGEMLAAGLPIIANSGIGDIGEIVGETECGAVIESFHRQGYERALDGIERCSVSAERRRERATTIYDVQLGIDAYDRLYQRLLEA